MNHLTLTDAELKDVATFWSTYLKGGGEGDKPSAFYLEALNDSRFRDAFLFWQAGGALDVGFPKAQQAYDLLGPLPTDFDRVITAQADLMASMNDGEIESDDVDTVTVAVCSYAIWATLLGRYYHALEALGQLYLINVKYAAVKYRDGDESGIFHRDPLAALTNSVKILAKHAELDPEGAMDIAREAFGVADGSPAHTYITEQTKGKFAKATGGQDGGN